MSDIREPDWLQAEREYDDDMESYGTIPELFERSAQKHLDREAQLYKGDIYDRSLVAADVVPAAPTGEFTSLSYREMRDIVRHLATGFREIGLEAKDRVGIFANTRMEWAQTDFSLLAAGCVATTVYTDSGPEQVKYLLSDPGASAVVVENERLLDRVLEVEDELDIEHIVLIDDPDTSSDRDDVYTLAEIHDMGAEAFDEDTYEGWLEETNPDDLASLIYTSGTTGKPKGVRLTHWNFRSNFHQIRRRAGPRENDSSRLSFGPDTRAISFLPLAHVFERQTGHFMMFGSGGSVGYVENTDTIAEDFGKIKPTSGGSVPRVYERIFDGMRDQAGEGPAGPLKEKIFDWALGVAKQYQATENPGTVLEYQYSLADSLVYSDLKEKLGGNVELMVSGGGSLSEDLCRIFNGMGVTIAEGYGLTETSPVITVNPPNDIRPGTLGCPVVDIDAALDQSKGVDEDTEAEDSIVGELLVRGDNVTSGYWNKPGPTERAFEKNPVEDNDDVTPITELTCQGSGKWFRTGDLVEQRPDGYLVFHERLKQIFVLDTGKNVAPQPIEDEFATDNRIEQIIVIGDDRKFVSALVVPNYERIDKWADTNDIDLPDSRSDIANHERAVDWIAEAIAGGNDNLSKHEQIKKFALVPEEWTAENDLLTPSMKKKRRTILDRYEYRIEKIYGEQEE